MKDLTPLDDPAGGGVCVNLGIYTVAVCHI